MTQKKVSPRTAEENPTFYRTLTINEKEFRELEEAIYDLEALQGLLRTCATSDQSSRHVLRFLNPILSQLAKTHEMFLDQLEGMKGGAQ